MRLNKYLAQSGVASRRHADELIAGGLVRIDGRVVTALGTPIEDGARVEVNGRIVKPPSEATYLLMHKPAGVVTTMRDPQRRRTVAGLLPKGPRVVPVGRLDYGTTGVLLLTDDGELAHRLLHPRFGVDKTYRASIAGRLTREDVRRLCEGVALDGFRAAAARVRVVKMSRDRCVVDLTIHEGRNRQVRRMFEALGHRVLALARTRFGPLRLGGLAAGRFRPLTEKERAALERHRRPPDEAPRTKPNTTCRQGTRGIP
ncbi:MAG: rRNA pseudouridine synthase [Candidatus Eremiobacteraeota bacterium]|nr:rRNA pseudouridine synthase [Candidatus Eremiobacteraeota bacterium]